MSGPPESIISLAVDQAVRENPAGLARDVIQMMRRTAELEAENRDLRLRLAELSGRRTHPEGPPLKKEAEDNG